MQMYIAANADFLFWNRSDTKVGTLLFFCCTLRRLQIVRDNKGKQNPHSLCNGTMCLGEQMWEWCFREFMTDFHSLLDQFLQAYLVLWKDGGIIKYRWAIISQVDFRIQLKWQQINPYFDWKRYKNYLEKPDNLSFTAKKSMIYKTFQKKSISLQKCNHGLGIFPSKSPKLSIGCIMYGISAFLFLFSHVCLLTAFFESVSNYSNKLKVPCFDNKMIFRL